MHHPMLSEHFKKRVAVIASLGFQDCGHSKLKLIDFGFARICTPEEVSAMPALLEVRGDGGSLISLAPPQELFCDLVHCCNLVNYR